MNNETDGKVVEFKKKEAKPEDAPAILACSECGNTFWLVTEDLEHVCGLCYTYHRLVD